MADVTRAGERPITPQPVRQAREALAGRLAPGLEIQHEAGSDSFQIVQAARSADAQAEAPVTVDASNAQAVLELAQATPSSTLDMTQF